MAKPRILAFSGSMRVDSWNTKLVRIAAAAAEEAGAEVTVLELRDYPMPVYDGDLEAAEGLPDNAKKLKTMFGDHDGLLIASPENNSSFSAALKNAIDWVSRKDSSDEPMLRDLTGRYAAIMAASPGALGGLRGLYPLRMLLEQVGITVIPQQRAVSQVHEHFDDAGNLTQEQHRSAIEGIGRTLAELLIKLKS